MSAFQISITPTRSKESVRKNEARQPVLVILAPFSMKATVVFEDIPVKKIARRFLNICNPSEDELKIILTKGFKPELNISVEWTSNVIPPKSEIQMEIVWNPLDAVTCNESIQFTDNRNFRKDVFVILKSVKKGLPSQNAVRYPNISCGPSKQSNVKSSAVATAISKSQPLSKVSKSDMNVEKQRPHKSPPYIRNVQLQQDTSPSVPALGVEKENVSPVTPKNASDLFDMFKFTPATETKTKHTSNLEILSSMPTPVNRKQGELTQITEENEGRSLNPRRLESNFESEISTKRKRWSPRIVVHSCTSPHGNKQSLFDPQVCSTTSKRSTPEKRLAGESEDIDKSYHEILFGSKVEINKTFELHKASNDSVGSDEGSIESTSSELVMNKTTTVITPKSRGLSVIQEEVKQESSKCILQKTFDMVDDNLFRDVKLVGTPLRKGTESLKDLSHKNRPAQTQGSMPNLNEMGTIKSIEENRYYRQPTIDQFDLNSSDCWIETHDTSIISVSSVVSVQEVAFNQHEILAQSSRFNVHESGRKISSSAQSKTSSKQVADSTQIQKRASKHSLDSPNSQKFLTVENDFNSMYCMAVSPPKRTKIDSNASAVRPGTNFRTTKWSATQPKKFILQRPSANVIKKPLTPRKIKTEPRVMLYDSDLYLQPYINPDPFAATTTFDPFLASTMYLDDRSVSKHEQQFKKWLNALVTLPADLDADCSQKIDVGRLFNEVRNKDLILAPTKEDQSMNYLTKSRMDGLRKAAVRLFMSEEMIEPCSKVAVYINKHSIEMRKDRDLHLDVVMQRYILELLLNFNPLWLRIGLEVVFGEIISLNSNSDVVGLSTFILNRLFRDRFLEQKHSRAYTLSEQYATHIKKFTLQKFLFLLLFLDAAKNKKIIKHNPCLFVKSSKYKETKDILHKFSSELLANVGDITRNLKRLGYVLTHKQSFLDEFNYAFNNLAVDLRDGIRLTRVMEIILLREDLTKQLRAPAISRLQRVFNVNLALKALADADFVLTGDIYSADIVDGHREKTLSLLWQIIYKFRSPKFHAAATVIQKFWRSSWLKVVVQRRIRLKIELKRNKAAIRIQSAYRAYLTRKYTKLFKWERTNAAICFQKYIRRYLAVKHLRFAFRSILAIQRWYRYTTLAKQKRAEFLRMKTSTVAIQKWYRRMNLSRKLEKAAPLIRKFKAQAKVEYHNAIIIQRVLKSYTIRKKLQSIVHGVVRFNRRKKIQYISAVRIQSFFQMIRLRREYIIKRTATIKIQQFWRSYRLSKTIRSEYLVQRQSAISIQVAFRSYLIKKATQQKYKIMKTSAIIIQRRFRATQLAKLKRLEFLELRSKTLTIQRRFRATLLMRTQFFEYQQLRMTVIRLQRKCRANRLMRIQRCAYITLKSSAVTIQRQFRAQILMKRHRFAFELLRSSTLKIQRKLRATLLGRKVRLEFLAVQFHAILIQERFRANKLMQQHRMNYVLLRKTTVSIQRMYRAKKLMRSTRDEYFQMKSAATIIQRRFRAHRTMRIIHAQYVGKLRAVLCIQKCVRKHLRRRKMSAIIIQRRFRALLIMRKVRSQYLRLRSAATVIQTYFIAFRLMRKYRTEFVQQRNAALVIQRRLRAQYARNAAYTEYNAIRKAAITIQQKFRGQNAMKLARNQYQIYRQSALILQRQYRAYKSMTFTRSDYLQLRRVVLNIQCRFRANLLRNKIRSDYLEVRNSAVIIQRRFRANRAMQIAREDFMKLRNATILIQERFRANKSMKMERSRYLQKQRAAIIIQSHFRATLLRNKHRAEYHNSRNAILMVQSIFRAKLAMRKARINYQQLRKSTVLIQRWFIAIKAMHKIRTEYNEIRYATITIQRWYRFEMLLRFDRLRFERLRNAAITLQNRFRAQLQMHRTRQEYVTKRNSAIKIQEWYRRTKIQQQQRTVFIRTLKSVTYIQTYWRATIEMRIIRSEYLRIRTKTVVIQRFMRSYFCMKSQRKQYLSLKYSAIVIQQHYSAYKAMLQARTRYQTMKSAAVKIQRWFRATIVMRIVRQRFLELRSATIYVQQKYRGRIATREQRLIFLKIKNTTLGLQTYIRGWLARRRYNDMLTPELREAIRRKRAARLIQRFWRGYAIRKQWQSLKIRVIRNRIKELKAKATVDQTVKSKVTTSIKALKQHIVITDILNILQRIDNISRTIPHVLQEHAVFVATFCYGIMAQAIRSEPDKQIIELCSRIILNLARCKETTEDSFQECGLVTIAQMLLRWCDKDCGIFNTLCTLVWVFGRCAQKKKVIRKFMTTKEAMFMVRETRKLVIRKENMRLRSRRPGQQSSQLHSPNIPRQAFPHVKPDFGVAKHKPYIFICPIFAFDTILSNLNIRITT